ncbi:hypothetical protein [Vibrio lentus]|uniref:hypothetical protein n=1 Tax=Vibrio lentus TaxID=136468 RepID=UPI0010BD2171|nr:hypothetical protein [Vibrio lentus]TKG17742.1 hypothetical protein FCW05_12610 [Vibrio lentus]
MATLSNVIKNPTSNWVAGVNTKNPERVKELQKTLGVEEDGIYGAKTQAAHNAILTSQMPQQPTTSATMEDLNNKFAKSNGGAAGAEAVNESFDWSGFMEGASQGATAAAAIGSLFDDPKSVWRQGASPSSTASALSTLLSPIGRL